MNWAQAGEAIVWAILIVTGFWIYVEVVAHLCHQLLRWLEGRRVQREFRALLKREQRLVDDARKARIDQWVTDEEAAYLARIQANYGSPAEAATREDKPRIVHQTNNSSDDADGFVLDYADQQPHRPQGPRAA